MGGSVELKLGARTWMSFMFKRDKHHRGLESQG